MVPTPKNMECGRERAPAGELLTIVRTTYCNTLMPAVHGAHARSLSIHYFLDREVLILSHPPLRHCAGRLSGSATMDDERLMLELARQQQLIEALIATQRSLVRCPHSNSCACPHPLEPLRTLHSWSSATTSPTNSAVRWSGCGRMSRPHPRR